MWKSLGPMILSAFSLLITSLIIQPIALLLDPTFNLLANRGIGKIAFTTLVIFHILLILSFQSKEFLQQWLTTNVRFLRKPRWYVEFLQYFSLFFMIHAALLFVFFLTGYVVYNPEWGIVTISLLWKLLFGFIVTFFLAWTEELIFRGTVYPFFRKTLSVLPSVFLTSLIFMLAHDLTNPLNLVTTHWRLGMGLFQLGFLLNLAFALTKKLYVGMGMHAGLVFVKVFLRRAHVITYLPLAQLPYFVNSDLRQSTLVHILFGIINISLIIIYRKKLLR